MHMRTLFTIALLAAALDACGGSGYGGGSTGPAEVPANDHTVVGTSSQAFNPGTITVNAGQVVTFDFRRVAHNVFFDAQAGAPANVAGNNANTTVARTFATAGTYRFTCHIHPSMHGTVVVR